MKVALDTNALLNLLDNDGWTERMVRYFNYHKEAELYVLLYVREELDFDKLSVARKRNYKKLEKAITSDDQRYFTIGVSVIGGNDVLRGDGAERLGIEQIVIDKSAAYEKYCEERKAKGLPPKDVRTWLNRNLNQNDSVIFERAEELGCNYVVSDNKDILRAKNSFTLPIKLEAFVELIVTNETAQGR